MAFVLHDSFAIIIMTVQDIFAHKASDLVAVVYWRPAQCSVGDAKDEVVYHASSRNRTKINYEFISINRIVPFINQLTDYTAWWYVT